MTEIIRDRRADESPRTESRAGLRFAAAATLPAALEQTGIVLRGPCAPR